MLTERSKDRPHACQLASIKITRAVRAMTNKSMTTPRPMWDTCKTHVRHLQDPCDTVARPFIQRDRPQIHCAGKHPNSPRHTNNHNSLLSLPCRDWKWGYVVETHTTTITFLSFATWQTYSIKPEKIKKYYVLCELRPPHAWCHL